MHESNIIFFLGDDTIACNEPFPSGAPGILTEMTLRQGILNDARCTLIGMALYFFIMSAALWWCMLTVIW